MLDLQARVHFQEIEAGGVAGPIEQEFNRAGIAISRRTRDGHRRLAHPFAERRRQRRRWRLLDHFLVPPLNRTLALEEVDDVAVVIGEDLELDVARFIDQPLDIQRAVAEGGRRFTPGLRDRALKRRRVANHLHPDSSAAFRGLQEEGEPDASRGCHDGGIRLIGRCLARDDGHAGLLCQTASRDLRPHAVDDVGRRANEGDASLLTRGWQARVLREEPVTRMHRLCSARARGADDRLHREIAFRRSGRTDQDGAIGERRVKGPGISL